MSNTSSLVQHGMNDGGSPNPGYLKIQENAPNQHSGQGEGSPFKIVTLGQLNKKKFNSQKKQKTKYGISLFSEKKRSHIV